MHEPDYVTCRLNVKLKIKLNHFTGFQYNSYLHSVRLAKGKKSQFLAIQMLYYFFLQQKRGENLWKRLLVLKCTNLKQNKMWLGFTLTRLLWVFSVQGLSHVGLKSLFCTQHHVWSFLNPPSSSSQGYHRRRGMQETCSSAF